jgi:hypothetical protein
LLIAPENSAGTTVTQLTLVMASVATLVEPAVVAAKASGVTPQTIERMKTDRCIKTGRKTAENRGRIHGLQPFAG